MHRKKLENLSTFCKIVDESMQVWKWLEKSCASYATVCLCIHINSCLEPLPNPGTGTVTEVLKTAFVIVFA